MIQFAAHYPWLIPLLPLLACLLTGATGWKLKGQSHWWAILAMIGSCALSIALLVGLSNGTLHPDSLKNLYVFEWMRAGAFYVPVSVTIDQLTAIYLSFVTGISLLIFIYSIGYMKGDYGYWRFFAYLSIFVFFMTCLVMGNNFLLLYLGWEGVGLASYLLIGYYYPRPSAVKAAKKAFITNRVGDFGLAIGLFLIYRYFGTLTYSGIFSQISDPAQHEHLAALMPILKYIPFCLMLGAFGKSAQFPLHVWLPDAMEGPTPVSALIHAATMVTAGIYLIARAMPLFLMDPSQHIALDVVACVGGFTAFLAASIALCQYDLKRIWAYSTLSQLGYMFMGLGVMASASAVFHVFTHAFFKALLFLSAGSVMHAMGGELDIRKMSGIRRVMPITSITMLIGCLALAGIPGFAGFFSKDEIIAAAINATSGPGFYLGILGLVVALMTAFYTFRVYFKVFTGPLVLPGTAGHHEPSPFEIDEEQAPAQAAAPAIPGHTLVGKAATGIDTLHAKQGHEESSHGLSASGHPHGAAVGSGGHGHSEHGPSDGSPLMWIPLLVLCIGAIGAGYLGWERTGDWFHKFLSPALAGATGHGALLTGEAGHRVSETVLGIFGWGLPFLGLALAAFFYRINRHAADIAAANLRPLVRFLNNKWYIDEIYGIFIVGTLWLTAQISAAIDRFVIDGVVYVISFLPQVVGYSLKPTQRGILQRYAVGMIAGLAAIVLAVMYLVHVS